MMAEEAYTAAYQILNRENQDNCLSMKEYPPSLERLKAEYLNCKNGTALPVVP